MERQDLLNALTDAMRGITRDDLLGGRVVPGRVKSRLVEAHAPESSSDGVGHLLRSVADDANLTLERLGDDLWGLLGTNDAFLTLGALVVQLRRLAAERVRAGGAAPLASPGRG